MSAELTDTLNHYGLQDVEIRGKRLRSQLREIEGASIINMSLMDDMPHILGNADPMHYAQLLPGVQTNSEYDAGLHIQGCDNSHNFVSLGGAPIYNAAHLLGFFSIFNAGLFHYQFVTIHPYYDGNGRTARLVTSYLMRKYGYGLKGIYSLEEYYAKNLPDYYNALVTHPHHNYYYGRNNADITSWLEYFIKGVSEAFANIDIKASAEQNNKITADIMPMLRNLDIKQRKILELFTEYKEITSNQAGQYLGLSSQSARLLLNKWVEAGFLKMANKAKKNRTYCLSEQYEKLLME